jgi:hypothetical protein
MWPFTANVQGLWLALYILTLALHAVFVGYVLVGTAYALVRAIRRQDDAIAEQIRDRLPFMLGCGITAGVAPLLFLQLLYQRHFYSTNLIMGPRWGAVVPALIAGFYALYLAKSSTRWRRPALALATVCFLFVAWSWTEMHLLMQDEPAWKTMYAAGARLYDNAGVVPRLALWLGVFATAFATVAAWTARGADRQRLAWIGIAGRLVAAVAIAWLVARNGATDAHGWSYLLAVAVVVELVGWFALWRSPDGNALLVVTAGGTAALVAGAVVREASRIAMLESPRAAATSAGGLPVFVATMIFGVAALAWIVRTIRTARD